MDVNAGGVCAGTLNGRVTLLLLAIKSKVAGATEAELVMTNPGVVLPVRTTRLKVAVAPVANWAASTTLIVPFVPMAGVLSVQPAGALSDWKVKPEGSTSVREVPTTASGPLLAELPACK